MAGLRRFWGSLAIIVLSLLLTIMVCGWMGYDFRYLSTAVIGDQADSYLEAWSLYQASDNLLHRPNNLGYSTILYGEPQSFGYTSAPYGIALAMLPVYLLMGSNFVLSYNLYFVATFVLSAWAMYVLVRYLFKTPFVTAMVAGWMFAFAQYRFVQIAHIEPLSTQFMLLGLYCFHQLLDQPRWGWAIALAFAFAFTLLASGYLGMILIVMLMTLFLYGLWADRLSRRHLLLLVVSGVLAFFISLPFFSFRLGNPSLSRGWDMDVMALFSATLESVFSGSSLIYSNATAAGTYEGSIFVGFIPLILAYFGWRYRGLSADDEGDNRAFSVRQIVIVYAVLIVVGYMLAFGPALQINRVRVVPLPYLILMQFPGFSALRALGRFAFIIVTGITILSAYALTVFSRRFAPRQYALLLMGIVLVVSIELIPSNGAEVPDHIAHAATIPIEDRPLWARPLRDDIPINLWLAQQPPETAVLNWPIGFPHEFNYFIYLPFHHQPMVNGAEVFFTPDSYSRMDWVNFPNKPIMDKLEADGVSYILIYRAYAPPQDYADLMVRWGAFEAEWGKIPFVQTVGDTDIYEARLVPK